ncbi:MAG: hypothetical protein ACJ797_00330 [Ktedonobacteraceae bacterium]
MQTLITVGIIALVFALITALLIPVVKKMTRDAQWEYELRRDGVTVQAISSLAMSIKVEARIPST